MRSRLVSVKQVAGAKLDARTLRLDTLLSAATPCLNCCQAFLRRSPDEDQIATALRSLSLKEAAHDVFPFSCHTEFNESLVDEFKRFAQRRAELPSSGRLSREVVFEELQRPQALLVTDWAASLFDGALTPETHGFVDEDCMPPWDTWIDLVQVKGSQGVACLLSWVPRWAADEMNFAIQVDAAECLSWLVGRDGGRLSLNGWGKAWGQS